MIKQTKVVVDNVGKRTIGKLNDYVKKIEQALDDIEKICNSIPKDHGICDIGKIHDIEEIIQKAKGDVKNESKS